MPPTPWQQHVLDVALEVDAGTGRLHYREVRLWVPRQSGKTSLLLGLMLHRCLSWDDQRVVYTAQTRNHARAKFVDEHLPILRRSPFLPLFAERMSNGSEQIKFGDRESRWGIDSTTKKAGHGDSLDLVVADEFFAQEDDRLESGIRPTMITRPQPQMWFVSTFGEDDENVSMGGPLWVKVDDGRSRCMSGNHGSVAYFEWSAADIDNDELDYGDVDLWRSTMPALECNGGIITEEAIRADFESMSLPAFKRAYLNLRPRKHETNRLFPGSLWFDAEDRLSTVAGGRVAFGFDVAPDSGSASVAWAGVRGDGKWHGEVVESAEGSSWVVPRVVQAVLAAGSRVVSVAATATGGALIPELRAVLAAQGVTVDVVEVAGKAYGQACDALYGYVTAGEFRHIGQDWLNVAVAGARQREQGDVKVWDRKRWSVDITPLCAVTVALRAFQQTPEPVKQRTYAF